MDKYDISKSFKLSDRNLQKLAKITDDKKFKNDSEAVRFCINTIYALKEKDLLVEALGRLVEDID